MKKIYFKLVLIGILLILNNSIFSQNKLQKGIFSCFFDGHIIYLYENDEGGEEPLDYTIKSIDIITNKQELIASKIKNNNCSKITDTSMAFIVNNQIISYNTETKLKRTLFKSTLGNKITGFDVNPFYIFLIQIDFKKCTALVSVIDFKSKQNLFSKQIKLIAQEMEGVYPIIKYYDKTYTFSLQGKIYFLSLNNKPKLNEIQLNGGPDGFAIDDSNIVYLENIQEGELSNYVPRYYEVNKQQSSKDIDQSLNVLINKCVALDFFTLKHNNKNISCLIICGTPYLLINKKWEKVKEVILYDSKIIKITLSFKKDGKVDLSSFNYLIK